MFCTGKRESAGFSFFTIKAQRRTVINGAPLVFISAIFGFFGLWEFYGVNFKFVPLPRAGKIL